MRNIVVGLLAHVDAGKTTLAESLLHVTGAIRKPGRVDHGTAHLDFDPIERDRGITIFSKQAVLELDDTHIDLLDTPGHVDFCAEAERTLQVLDLAVLVIGANDGVTGHAKTLWRLLERYAVPTVVFVNKMDLAGSSKSMLMDQLSQQLDNVFFEQSRVEYSQTMELLALQSEATLDELFETGKLGPDSIRKLVLSRLAVPCVFGSALVGDGVTELLDTLVAYAPQRMWCSEFGARVYRIEHDPHGERVAWLRVTGASLVAKCQLSGVSTRGESWSDKVDQIRLYQGERHTVVREVQAGQICAVTGLSSVCPGDGLGYEQPGTKPKLLPVLDYKVIVRDQDVHAAHRALELLADEDPLLGVAWNEELQELRVQLMGAIQQEVVQRLLLDRHGLHVDFGPGSVLYKETVAQPTNGIGHFEPLRHYAEVHVRIEPGARGSGVTACSECSEDELARNWQRLILTHMLERPHKGVLVGAPLTDVRIVLTAGSAHAKHTEGGDFRQATYRAIRQGLMQASSVLLEPWYNFLLEVPSSKVGRALSDLQRMSAHFEAPNVIGDMARLEGNAPVSEMRDYALQVSSYTAGAGSLWVEFGGYEKCHDADKVIEEYAYQPEANLAHTPDSIFCSHGAGYTVKWFDVADYAHVDAKGKNTGA